MSTKKYYDSQNNEVDNSELLELSEILGISNRGSGGERRLYNKFSDGPSQEKRCKCRVVKHSAEWGFRFGRYFIGITRA